MSALERLKAAAERNASLGGKGTVEAADLALVLAVVEALKDCTELYQAGNDVAAMLSYADAITALTALTT